ncbi:MAG: tRNA-dihydrouridine synthase family protein [Deltaproteobacteria bacterium]|nr:tRNA-dihydrouridine synthase family protein [Deltaproteobacteria bacterium]
MTKLNSFNIGNIKIDPPLILAPMAGISHSPFRRLVAGFKPPGLFYSEMLSARHLMADVDKNSFWLQRTAVERPMAYQIVAAGPEEAAAGALALQNYGAEIIDLNLACPAPNIARRKSGAYLLSDLKLVETMLRAIRREINKPFTVKIRLGKRPDLPFLGELTALLNDLADAIILHPRLTSEKLKRRARWEYIGHLKDMAAIPIIGNGDVKNRHDCLKMFAQTGCDGVMIGRAAVQKPWIFAGISGAAPEIDPDFLFSTYTEAFQLIRDFFPTNKALGRIKEFTWHFSRNLRFGNRLAARMQSIHNIDACFDFIRENFIRAY